MKAFKKPSVSDFLADLENEEPNKKPFVSDFLADLESPDQSSPEQKVSIKDLLANVWRKGGAEFPTRVAAGLSRLTPVDMGARATNEFLQQAGVDRHVPVVSDWLLEKAKSMGPTEEQEKAVSKEYPTAKPLLEMAAEAPTYALLAALSAGAGLAASGAGTGIVTGYGRTQDKDIKSQLFQMTIEGLLGGFGGKAASKFGLTPAQKEAIAVQKYIKDNNITSRSLLSESSKTAEALARGETRGAVVSKSPVTQQYADDVLRSDLQGKGFVTDEGNLAAFVSEGERIKDISALTKGMGTKRVPTFEEMLGSKSGELNIKDDYQTFIPDNFFVNKGEQPKNTNVLGETVKKQTGALKGLYNRILKSSSRVLNDSGEDGKKLLNVMENFWSKHVSLAGKYKEEFSQVLRKVKPSVEDFELVVDAVEGKINLPDNRLKPLYDVLVKQGKELGQFGEKSGMITKTKSGDSKQFKSLGNYWRRNYTKKFLETLKNDPNKQSEVVNRMVERGEVKNIAEASDLLKQFLLRKTGRRIGEQYERSLNIPEGYTKTPADWFKHIDDMTKKIVEARDLGNGDNNIARQLVNKLKQQGYDWEVAQQVVDRMLGTEVVDGIWKRIYNVARNSQSISKLGPLTSVLNYFQRYQIIPRTDTSSYIKARMLNFSDEAMDWAVRSGLVEPKEYNQTSKMFGESLQGLSGKAANLYLKGVGMQRTELNNRVLGANAGRFFAEKMANKLKISPKNKVVNRALRSLGIDPESVLRNGLTEDDLIKASQKVVNDTQFRYGVLDLPVSWSSSAGRTAFQFKPAAFQQTKFIKDFILPEAKKGNIRPLIQFLVASQASGEVMANLRYLKSGKELKDRPSPTTVAGLLKRSGENVSMGPGFGILSDTINLFLSGSPTWVKGLFVGPTGSKVIDTATAVQSSIKTKSAKPIAKEFVKDISPLLSKKLFPKEEKKKKAKKSKVYN